MVIFIHLRLPKLYIHVYNDVMGTEIKLDETSGSNGFAVQAKEAKLLATTEVTGIFRDIKVKDRLEKKAFDALSRRLEEKSVCCKSCKGEGSKNNGETCGICDGVGYVVVDADMRAIELVLAPKFPKTQINVNADLDGMTTSDILDMISAM